ASNRATMGSTHAQLTSFMIFVEPWVLNMRASRITLAASAQIDPSGQNPPDRESHEHRSHDHPENRPHDDTVTQINGGRLIAGPVLERFGILRIACLIGIHGPYSSISGIAGTGCGALKRTIIPIGRCEERAGIPKSGGCFPKSTAPAAARSGSRLGGARPGHDAGFTCEWKGGMGGGWALGGTNPCGSARSGRPTTTSRGRVFLSGTCGSWR